MMEVEVRKLLDVTETIHDEMFQLRERYNLIKFSNRKKKSKHVFYYRTSIVLLFD